MKKQDAKHYIEKMLEPGESLVGFFIAVSRPPFWAFLFLGPFATFMMKQYFVGVTNKRVHFHKLNLLGKFSQHDAFRFDEITQLKIGRGLMQLPMEYKFASGQKLKLGAQKVGIEKVAKIDDATVAHLSQHIKSAA